MFFKGLGFMNIYICLWIILQSHVHEKCLFHRNIEKVDKVLLQVPECYIQLLYIECKKSSQMKHLTKLKHKMFTKIVRNIIHN